MCGRWRAEGAREVSLANPLHHRNVELGLIVEGDDKKTASRKIVDTFDSIDDLVAHVAVIDMAAAFELLFRARLGTAIGEARKRLSENYSIDTMFAFREDLVRGAADLQGLGEIGKFVRKNLSDETADAFQRIKDPRNRFAHGTDIGNVPAIQRGEIRDTLNRMAEPL